MQIFVWSCERLVEWSCARPSTTHCRHPHQTLTRIAGIACIIMWNSAHPRQFMPLTTTWCVSPRAVATTITTTTGDPTRSALPPPQPWKVQCHQKNYARTISRCCKCLCPVCLCVRVYVCLNYSFPDVTCYLSPVDIIDHALSGD